MKPSPRQQFILPNLEPISEIRTTLDSTLPYAEHFHSSFSFGLILGGHTRFFLGKEAYLAEAGDIVLIAPEQVHSCNPVGKVARSYQMVHVDAAWFHEYVGMLLYKQRGLRVAKPLIRNIGLFAEARALLDAVCAGYAVTGHDLAKLLIKMNTLHQCFLPPSDAPGRNASPLTESFVAERIMVGDYSVSALAHAAGLRRESFSRSIHRTTGLPPSCYLHCLRLQYGRHLLQEGRSIAEAAIASGYVDQSHFHRMFVKYCSVTPGNYRKNQSHPYKK